MESFAPVHEIERIELACKYIRAEKELLHKTTNEVITVAMCEIRVGPTRTDGVTVIVQLEFVGIEMKLVQEFSKWRR